MRWSAIKIKGKNYSLDHIHPHEFKYKSDDLLITVKVTYGFHVFTDEKENGKLIQCRGEERYFCKERYDISFSLPDLIQQQLIKSYITRFLNPKRKERFYYMDLHDYTVFFELRLAQGTTDVLKLHIVSAYEKDQWGSLPNGKKYKWGFIAHAKLEGKKIK